MDGSSNGPISEASLSRAADASEAASFSCFAVDAAETERLGEALGGALEDGALILLFGNLGAGKTTFAHGLGRGLEIASAIQSPTFALIYEHRGRLPLAHMDFYRLESPNDLDALGIDEYVEGDGVVLIEWPEIALDQLPDSRLEIRLLPEGSGRRIEAAGLGSAAALVVAWKAALSRLKG